MNARWMLAAALCGGAVFAQDTRVPTAAPVPAAQPPFEGWSQMWKDPEFQKQFLGSYAYAAEIEPRLSAVEKQQLEKIIPLLGNDPAAAKAELAKIARPDSSALLDFTLGNLELQEGSLDIALDHYRTAVAKFPSFRRAWKNMALIQVQQANFDNAIRSFSRVLELGGTDGLTWGLLGYAYAGSGNQVSAESAYRSAALLQPDSLDWKLGLIQSVLRQQKYAEAAALTEELISKNPDRADFWLIQAAAYIGMGQPMRAAEDYEVAVRLGAATIPVWQTLGDIYANEHLLDLAARSYREALLLDASQPLQKPIRNVEVLVQRGALDQASGLIEAIQQSASEREGGIEPADRRTLLKLEARLAVARGQGGDAAKALQEVVALDPLDGEALLLLGQYFQKENDPVQAIAYYERAESLEAFEADAKVRHAQVLVAQSRYGEAVPLLKRAQEIRPRDEVARFLEQVERVARSRG